MILYIPTSEAHELLDLLSKYGNNLNESWRNDMMWQIKEQLPKQTKTVKLSDAVKKEVEISLKEHKII